MKPDQNFKSTHNQPPLQHTKALRSTITKERDLLAITRENQTITRAGAIQTFIVSTQMEPIQETTIKNTALTHQQSPTTSPSLT